MLGVSPDTVADQAQFKAQEKLPFTLLSDEAHTVAMAYGLWQPDSDQQWVPRTTFLISPDGTIEDIYEKVDAKKHSTWVLTTLADLSG